MPVTGVYSLLINGWQAVWVHFNHGSMAQEMDADGNGLISRQEFEDTLTDERASECQQHQETDSLKSQPEERIQWRDCHYQP